MILAKGQIFPSSEQDKLLANLEAEINETLTKGSLNRETVLSAIDVLGKQVTTGRFDHIIQLFLQEDAETIRHYIEVAMQFMSSENLRYRLNMEFGADLAESQDITPPYGIKKASICYAPLGTLFHIAAGNMDALPAFTVIEGLLTGNINILKLPQADNGLTIEIFKQMIEIEPVLADYIYIFDTPSSDITAMQKMADIADGIVVWGGDEAVKAVRILAPVGAKLIEWGHRLGFAYISGYTDREAELSALAGHVLDTRQLLCSSCQVIYVDTEDMADVYNFCEEFLPYLEAAAKVNPVTEIGAVAELSLRRYNAQLEAILAQNANNTPNNPNAPADTSPSTSHTLVEQHLFQGTGCSLTACTDSALELSYMYGNVLVKPLPEKNIIKTLRDAKGYLQTCGLICSEDKHTHLTDIFVRSGVNRIMAAGNMSVTFCGEAHDGEYPLRRYMRVINIEMQ